MRLTKWLLTGAGIAGASYATYAVTTWLGYGRPRRAPRDATDALLDTFMPDYDVCDRHEIAIDAPADVTFEAAKDLDLEDSRIVRAIFRARELILRAAPDDHARPRGMVAGMQAIGWGLLAESPGRELVMGAVTKPWQANPVFHALPPDEFAAFAEPDHVKIVWTLRAIATPDGGSVFRTETRAVATDPGARKKFRIYWSLLSPGILAIRSAILPVLKTSAERRWRVEGDDLLPDARAQLTHATTIDAPPKHVWPWLLQMGCQRAGWYSWDRLDNAGVRSADRIIPELQQLAVGDVLPARPEGSEGFRVLRILPERALVLGGIDPKWQGTWAFVLEPLAGNRTRLVTRYRAAYPPSARMAMLLPVLSTVHAFMERKQLRTIKHHAEHLAS
ncbi:MAG TPA: hypothetical protein VFQ53_01215 [Kofleriaceae bacterium]|nr:hypothetical protein [Kofleriaceae bacterium]